MLGGQAQASETPSAGQLCEPHAAGHRRLRPAPFQDLAKHAYGLHPTRWAPALCSSGALKHQTELSRACAVAGSSPPACSQPRRRHSRSYFFSNSPVRWRLTKVVLPASVAHWVQRRPSQTRQSPACGLQRAAGSRRAQRSAPNSQAHLQLHIMQGDQQVVRCLTRAAIAHQHQLEAGDPLRRGLARQLRREQGRAGLRQLT